MSWAHGLAMAFTFDVMIKELAREIALRRNVYPKWIETGRLKPDKAERQIAILQEIIDILKALKEGEDEGREA